MSNAHALQSQRPLCANPKCGNYARLGVHGRYLMYCDNPSCRKAKWYDDNLSAESRKTILDIVQRQEEKIDLLLELIQTTPHQQPLPLPSRPTPLTAKADSDIADSIEIKTATKSADNNANYNFLLSSAANVYGNYDNLPPEVIAYGIRTNRIPSDKIPRGPKQMIVNTDIQPPSFDDIELELG